MYLGVFFVEQRIQKQFRLSISIDMTKGEKHLPVEILENLAMRSS